MRLCIEILLFIGLLLVKQNCCSYNDVSKPKVAIVGAGIGGASTAHFLSELFNGDIEIDVFESNEIGGRLATLEVAGNHYEAGGAVIHPRNRYMKEFVELLGLEKKPTSEGMKFGIWNGKTGNHGEVYEIHGYHKAQLFDLYRHVEFFVDRFANIYKHQDNGSAYEGVTDLISAMDPDFPGLLEVSIADYLHFSNFSRRIIDELVQATLIGNYGQNTDVHSFVGFVSLAGAGAMADGGLWSVKGGNRKVPELLLRKHKMINLITSSQVTTIRYFLNREAKPQYEITYKNTESTVAMRNIYDIVVIAAPLTRDQEQPIKLSGIPEYYNPQFPGNYQTIWTTFVEGDINPSHCGSEKSMDGILSCDSKIVGINSVSKQRSVDGQTGSNSIVWNIFSKNRLSTDQINSMFSQDVGQVKDKLWKAYPKYSTDARSDKFELYNSLYHVNAIEWAASAMEMSAIAGRNVALLIHNKSNLNKQSDSPWKDHLQQIKRALFNLKKIPITFHSNLNQLQRAEKGLRRAERFLNDFDRNPNTVRPYSYVFQGV